MAKKKLERFNQIKLVTNVIEFSQDIEKSKEQIVEYISKSPIILDLACGKGDYTLELARRYPSFKFIGIDIKGDRLWRGSKTALEEGLQNVLFLRIQIENILEYFHKETISEIWITFPDPFESGRRRNRRLTSSRFIEYYKQLLKPNGLVHLKTDSKILYDYTQEVILENNLEIVTNLSDIHNISHEAENLDILTYYEKKHIKQGRKIFYISFSL